MQHVGIGINQCGCKGVLCRDRRLEALQLGISFVAFPALGLELLLQNLNTLRDLVPQFAQGCSEAIAPQRQHATRLAWLRGKSQCAQAPCGA